MNHIFDDLFSSSDNDSSDSESWRNNRKRHYEDSDDEEEAEEEEEEEGALGEIEEAEEEEEEDAAGDTSKDTSEDTSEEEDVKEVHVEEMHEFLHHKEKCKNSLEDVERMKKALEKDPLALERPGMVKYFKLTPLQSAVFYGDDQCFKFLLDQGADKTVTSSGNKNLLELAITSDWENDIIIKLLLDMGFTPTHKSVEDGIKISNKTYYLACAVKNEKWAAAQYLLDYGAVTVDFKGQNITFRNCHEFNAAAEAVTLCSSTSYNRLKFLLLNGAPVDAQGANLPEDADPELKDCFSLIHYYVCRSGVCSDFETESQILHLLHQLGANFWEKNRLGMIPIHVRTTRKVWQRERRIRLADILDVLSDRDECNDLAFYVGTRVLDKLMSTPLSLSSWCRLTLVRTMKTNYLKKLDSLPPMPSEVMKFLKEWP